MKNYELAREAPAVFSSIEELYRGARIITTHGELQSSVFDVTPGKRRYLALTMFTKDGVPIAICDTMSTVDTQFTVLEAPVNRRRADLPVPALELRALADVDGMYVAENRRGQGVGVLLLKTSLELAKRFGSRWYSVHNDESATKWYLGLGGKRSVNGVTFELK